MNDHNRLMKLKKDQLVRLAATLLDQADNGPGDYVYASDMAGALKDTFRDYGVPVDQDVTYEVHLTVHYRRDADLPDVEQVRSSLKEAIYRWIGDENPCVLNQETEIDSDFDVRIVRVVE